MEQLVWRKIKVKNRGRMEMNQELYWRRISCMICIVGIFLILLLYIILRCETAQITIENKNELV